MIDLMLLAGVALCVLSVVMAVVSVIRTRAPRGAALALVAGLVLLVAGTWLDPRPLGLDGLAQSWTRLTTGREGPAVITAPPAAAASGETPAGPATTEPAPEAAMHQGETGQNPDASAAEQQRSGQ